jgi:hypothetical protein
MSLSHSQGHIGSCLIHVNTCGERYEHQINLHANLALSVFLHLPVGSFSLVCIFKELVKVSSYRFTSQSRIGKRLHLCLTRIQSLSIASGSLGADWCGLHIDHPKYVTFRLLHTLFDGLGLTPAFLHSLSASSLSASSIHTCLIVSVMRDMEATGCSAGAGEES